MKTKYLEINIKTKQHLCFEFLPYGFGYDYPLFIIKLFIISFYIKLPFKIKEKDSDISYGFSFNDYDHRHWFPDYLRLSFGIHTKSYDMPWHPQLFETRYDAKILKGDIHIKDSDSYSRYVKYRAKIQLNDQSEVYLMFYKETRVLKCKVFGRFIDLGKKEVYVLNIEYEQPNYDLSEGGRTFDMMFLNPNETVGDGFNRYCKENNIKVLYNELLDL